MKGLQNLCDFKHRVHGLMDREYFYAIAPDAKNRLPELVARHAAEKLRGQVAIGGGVIRSAIALFCYRLVQER